MNGKKTIKFLLLFTAVLFLLMMMPATVFAAYDETYYVSANGNDANDGLTELTAFATLSKTAGVINSKGEGGNYLVIVTSDLESIACARYYDNSVTIKSQGSVPFTVTRGENFAAISDNARSWYNPAMIEIGEIDPPNGPKISLTLENIIFDDAYRHRGDTFKYAAGPDNTTYVQDAMIASYSSKADIILGEGAELRNFGGMSAIRATGGTTVTMKDGSLITDINSDESTRQVSSTATDYRANGEGAVIISDAHFYMYKGAKITNIANAHSVKLSGTGKFLIDGEIAYMKGNRGMDATDGNAANSQGRGFKNAVLFNRSTTLDPYTGLSGPAIIGPNANIHDNGIKCGAIGVNRAPNAEVKIYGKINNNTGLTGTNYISYGTNGGGLYVVNGGTVYLEDGSEICNNTVTNLAYGGAANIQQGSSKLIMNGGLISGNKASSADSGIVVNKGSASFEMNGGTIDNGINALNLSNDATQTNGNLILNGGNVSGVLIQSANVYGNFSARHLFVGEENVVISSEYVNVSGKKVYPVTDNFKIGNPNTAVYSTIKSNLPEEWTIPTTNGNVIGFWMAKDGTATFSVPAPPSGTAPTNYDRTLGIYFAAVQETDAAGAANTASPTKYYPTESITVDGADHIKISVPLSAYTNGATVALVQPTLSYDEIKFDGPEALAYDINADDYTVSYTATYDMPSGLHTELDTNGHTNANTNFIFTIRPDFRTVPNVTSLSLTSEIFEIKGIPVWNAVTGELTAALELKSGWDTASDLESVFEFDCEMDAANYETGFLSVSGELAIDSNTLVKHYLIGSNITQTEMKVPWQTVTYNSNGGNGTMTSGTVIKGDDYIIEANSFTRTGHSFTGWNTAADGSGTAHTAGATVANVQEDFTLYAQWKSSGGGSSGSGTGNATVVTTNGQTPSADPVKEPDEIQVEPSKPSVPGYQTGFWALANLIIGLAGVVLAALMIVRTLLRKQRGQTETGSKMRLLAAVVIFGILGIFLFLLTGDLTGEMILTDKWTYVSAAIFILEIAAAALILKQNKTEGEGTA